MKTILKKIASICVAVSMSASMTVNNVFADTSKIASANENSKTANSPALFASMQSKNAELNERLEAGETVPIQYFEDGSCLMVAIASDIDTVANSDVAVANDSNVASRNATLEYRNRTRTYNYIYKNWLGIDKDAFSLTFSVDYQLDYFNGTYYEIESKIISMNGSLTIHDSGFDVWWADGWTSYAPGYCTLGVQGIHGTELIEMAYSSSLNIFNGAVLIGMFYPVSEY